MVPAGIQDQKGSLEKRQAPGAIPTPEVGPPFKKYHYNLAISDLQLETQYTPDYLQSPEISH